MKPFPPVTPLLPSSLLYVRQQGMARCISHMLVLSLDTHTVESGCEGQLISKPSSKIDLMNRDSTWSLH